MRILLVGGGSGGHVTPLRAVANEISAQQADVEFFLITDHKYGSAAAQIFSDLDAPLKRYSIFAGKLRRYHHKAWWWHFVHLPTLLLNIRDIGYLMAGFVQSLWLIQRTRPDVAFCKGGFVCLPVGIAAHLLNVPIVLHDSDTVAGLTNRILSHFARAIAVGSSLESYNYPKNIVYETGIPVDDEFRSVKADKQPAIRQELELDPRAKILLVVGGGTGARDLNQVVASQARKLTKEFEVVHLTGVGKAGEVSASLAGIIMSTTQRERYKVIEFTSEMAKYIQASDLVISRAGATAIQEIAAVGKPLILVPGQQLSGGHQVKNAQVLEDKDAAIVFNGSDLKLNSEILTKKVVELMSSPNELEQLSKNIRQFRRPKAAHDIASVILSAASRHHIKQKIEEADTKL